MESLKIINQLGYNHFEENGLICITTKGNNQIPLLYSHDDSTDTNIYTDKATGLKIKVDSFHEVEAELGNHMSVKTEEGCRVVKLLVKGEVVLKVAFRFSGVPISAQDFDIYLDSLFFNSRMPDYSYSLDENGLSIRARKSGRRDNYDDRVDEFLKHLIDNVKSKLLSLCVGNVDEAAEKVYRALEPMITNRLNKLVQASQLVSYRKRKSLSGRKRK